MDRIYVQMLGEFSLRTDTAKISDTDNRTRKIWLLLAWLVCHRSQPTSQKKLIELLWGDEPASANPENALRITFHRARQLLNQLWPEAGHELIQRREGGYLLSPLCPITVDSEEFDALCCAKAEDPDKRLEQCMQAISLYAGEFLEKLSSEVWVIPIATHFHNQYIAAVMEAATLLAERGRHREAAAFCRKAAGREPYHEPLYQILIRELAASGDTQAAARVYDDLSRRLFDDFGIRPSPETRQVYRAAVHTVSDNVLEMDAVLEDLQEPEFTPGAMNCDYDYFKVLCFAESRSMERSGNAAHVVLLSVTSGKDVPLSRRSLNRIMDQLGEQIRTNLRRGDVFSRCSASQYIFMLPMANYENSCMVARRVLGAFTRKHPHVTARIHFLVQPLTPAIQVP